MHVTETSARLLTVESWYLTTCLMPEPAEKPPLPYSELHWCMHTKESSTRTWTGTGAEGYCWTQRKWWITVQPTVESNQHLSLIATWEACHLIKLHHMTTQPTVMCMVVGLGGGSLAKRLLICCWTHSDVRAQLLAKWNVVCINEECFCSDCSSVHWSHTAHLH